MVKGPDATHSAALHEMVAEIHGKAELAWRRWDVVNREEIYHYTSIDAAYNILSDRLLWSSDVLSMNDGSEFRYAVSIVDEVLMSGWNRLPIQLAEYFRPKKLLRIGSTWDMFAVSFCSEPDLLSQWRAYASDSRGVAIGFHLRQLHEFGQASNEFALVPIQYAATELRDEARQMCDFAVQLADSRALPYNEHEVFWSEVALMLLNFSIRFKNPSFAEEREWRTLSLNTDGSAVFRRGTGAKERRYVHVHFHPEIVSQVVVGPLAEANVEARLRQFLDDHGLRHVLVRRSVIPLKAPS